MTKAKLEKIIQTTCDVIGFLVYSGLAVDAIRNAVKGNYTISAIEGLASLYIGFEEYMRRQDRKFYNSAEQELTTISERLDAIPQEQPYND
jgi:hypothetical protein|tara:strand:+ start:2230 stop:2502 length:273 start_codon:yes stop_codon:yes gene_type:complete